MTRIIDLNADLGEGIGDDAAMLSLVTSANIACGGHAGDTEIMYATLQGAAARDVAVGAHPGYVDRANFGRVVVPMDPAAAGRMVAAQVAALVAVAALAEVQVTYVKPHGALANLAADDPVLASALAEAIHTVSPGLAVLAISGTALETVARARRMRVFSEIFADRAYLSSGRLVPRSHALSMLHDPQEAAARMAGFLRSGLMPVIDGPPIPLAADSICIHGDSPGAVAMARAIRTMLMSEGVTLRPFVEA